jgi:hypothetical protein
VAVAAAVVAAGMVDYHPVALADAMTLVDAAIAGPVLAAVVRDIRVRVHGPRVTAVQQRTRHGGMRVDPAAMPGARVGVVGPKRAKAHFDRGQNRSRPSRR